MWICSEYLHEVIKLPYEMHRQQEEGMFTYRKSGRWQDIMPVFQFLIKFEDRCRI
jgi:hypothetical protein